MFNRIAHFLYWLPCRIGNRLSRFSWPGGCDFSEETPEFSKEKGYRYEYSHFPLFKSAILLLEKKGMPRSKISLLDVGSGKGLLMIQAKRMGIAKVDGVELSDKFFSIGQNNLKLFDLDKEIKVFHGDASLLNAELDDYNVFNLFNPFPESVLRQFLKNLLESSRRKQSEIFVLYSNPLYFEVFTELGYRRIDELEYTCPYSWKHKRKMLFFVTPIKDETT